MQDLGTTVEYTSRYLLEVTQATSVLCSYICTADLVVYQA